MLAPLYPAEPTLEIVESAPLMPPIERLWINTVRSLLPNLESTQSFRQEMVTKANRFVELGPSWLGPGSCEIPRRTADRIIDLAVSLEQIEGLPNPEMTPNAHGTISVEWESARGEAYIEYGIDQISGFFRFKDEPMQHFEGLSMLPISFFALLRDRLFPISQTYSVTTEGMDPYGYASDTAPGLA